MSSPNDSSTNSRGNQPIKMRCVICGCTITHEKNIRQHLDGLRHKANLAKIPFSEMPKQIMVDMPDTSRNTSSMPLPTTTAPVPAPITQPPIRTSAPSMMARSSPIPIVRPSMALYPSFGTAPPPLPPQPPSLLSLHIPPPRPMTSVFMSGPILDLSPPFSRVAPPVSSSDVQVSSIGTTSTMTMADFPTISSTITTTINQSTPLINQITFAKPTPIAVEPIPIPTPWHYTPTMESKIAGWPGGVVPFRFDTSIENNRPPFNASTNAPLRSGAPASLDWLSTVSSTQQPVVDRPKNPYVFVAPKKSTTTADLTAVGQGQGSEGKSSTGNGEAAASTSKVVMFENGDSEFFCPLCKIRTQNAQSFQAHLSCDVHMQNAKEKGHKLKSFKCDICNIRGIPYSDENFLKHLISKSHIYMKAFILNDLIRPANEQLSNDSLSGGDTSSSDHHIYKFGERGGGLVECTLCNRVFPSANELLQHQQSEGHAKKLTTLNRKFPVLYFCESCDQSMLGRDAFMKHIRTRDHATAVTRAVSEDCEVFARLEHCTLGNQCPYRHCVPALTATETCMEWSLRGWCKSLACALRHPKKMLSAQLPSAIASTFEQRQQQQLAQASVVNKQPQQTASTQQEAPIQLPMAGNLNSAGNSNLVTTTIANAPFSFSAANVDLLKKLVETKLGKSIGGNDQTKKSTIDQQQSAGTSRTIDNFVAGISKGEQAAEFLSKLVELGAKVRSGGGNSAAIGIGQQQRSMTDILKRAIDRGDQQESTTSIKGRPPKIIRKIEIVTIDEEDLEEDDHRQKSSKSTSDRSKPTDRPDQPSKKSDHPVDEEEGYDSNYLFARFMEMYNQSTDGKEPRDEDAIDELLKDIVEKENRRKSRMDTEDKMRLMFMEKLLEKRHERRASEKTTMLLLEALAKCGDQSTAIGGGDQEKSMDDRALAMDYFMRAANGDVAIGQSTGDVGSMGNLIGGNQSIIGGNQSSIIGGNQSIAGRNQSIGGNQSIIGSNQSIIGGAPSIGGQQSIAGNQSINGQSIIGNDQPYIAANQPITSDQSITNPSQIYHQPPSIQAPMDPSAAALLDQLGPLLSGDTSLCGLDLSPIIQPLIASNQYSPAQLIALLAPVLNVVAPDSVFTAALNQLMASGLIPPPDIGAIDFAALSQLVPSLPPPSILNFPPPMDSNLAPSPFEEETPPLIIDEERESPSKKKTNGRDPRNLVDIRVMSGPIIEDDRPSKMQPSEIATDRQQTIVEPSDPSSMEPQNNEIYDQHRGPLIMSTGLNAVHTVNKAQLAAQLRRYQEDDRRTQSFVFGGKDWVENGMLGGGDGGIAEMEANEGDNGEDTIKVDMLDRSGTSTIAVKDPGWDVGKWRNAPVERSPRSRRWADEEHFDQHMVDERQNRGGNFDEGNRGNIDQQPNRGGNFDQPNRGGNIDRYNRGGNIDQSNRGGNDFDQSSMEASATISKRPYERARDLLDRIMAGDIDDGQQHRGPQGQGGMEMENRGDQRVEERNRMDRGDREYRGDRSRRSRERSSDRSRRDRDRRSRSRSRHRQRSSDRSSRNRGDRDRGSRDRDRGNRDRDRDRNRSDRNRGDRDRDRSRSRGDRDRGSRGGDRGDRRNRGDGGGSGSSKEKEKSSHHSKNLSVSNRDPQGQQESLTITVANERYGHIFTEELYEEYPETM